MGKKDEYRFNLRFDETDEMHRLVVKYLNSCGHNKAKYIVRAFLAYIWIGFAGSVFLMLDIVYLAIQEKGRKKCPACDSEISKKVRICPECGYLFQQGLSEEQLTGYIEQEQEKEMSSEQIDRAFEKTDNIAADEIDSFDGDINDFLQE